VSGDELITKVAEEVSRRSFLRRAAAAALTAAYALLGLPGGAKALYSTYCCSLCRPWNGGQCTGCACSWCWTCLFPANNRYYNCCECYSAGHSCNGTCSGVICSWPELIPGQLPSQ